MTRISHEQVLNDLAGLLRNFNGREYSGIINSQTRFFADLGLASIDAVVLGETIEEHYGRKIPFHEFMAELGRRQVRDIELGALVDFLHEQLNKG
ncbi:MAG: acyl carrier protein [Gemmataceae bacterium]|nr:acyl carrier protein [Gemmataceae bacterium]MDW8265366.1 phosphopantetheine-binding protein [Gemmataceae bacterium]